MTFTLPTLSLQWTILGNLRNHLLIMYPLLSFPIFFLYFSKQQIPASCVTSNFLSINGQTILLIPALYITCFIIANNTLITSSKVQFHVTDYICYRSNNVYILFPVKFGIEDIWGMDVIRISASKMFNEHIELIRDIHLTSTFISKHFNFLAIFLHL